jgi:hypothetical protein
MFKSKFTTIAVIASLTMITACTDRNDLFGNQPANVTFSTPTVVKLADSISYAEKRKVIDYNCDGIEDMIEVNDDAWVGQEYSAKVILGKKGADGIVEFEDTATTFKLPLSSSFGSTYKIDSADVNGDGCGDFVFTEYKTGFTSDSYTAKIAINQNKGTSFVFAKASYKEEVSLEDTIIRVLEALEGENSGYGEEISDHLMLDWADGTNDGKDDLFIFWRTSNDLIVTMLPVLSVDGDTVIFDEAEDAYIANFFKGSYMIKHLDTEDFNNDGLADMFLYKNKGEKIYINVAEANPNSFGYTVNKPEIGMGADLNYFAFEKVDTFDANLDGCADYAHFGVLDGLHSPSGVKYKDQKVVVYKFASCNK